MFNMQGICMIYVSNMHEYASNMYEICMKYAYNMQEIWQTLNKYAGNMQEICKKTCTKNVEYA
jgi:hypothetical protein